MSIRTRSIPSGLLLSVLVLALTACGGGGGGGTFGTAIPTPGAPALRILATDAPFPFEDVMSAVVEVHRVEMRQVGLGFEVLQTYSPPRVLDLVGLRNGAVDVLYAGDPAPGTYDAIRIVVSAKEITIDQDGSPVTFDEFKVPSGEQTGIKVFVDNHLEVSSSLTRDLVLDFDLGRSFVAQGNPNTPAGIKGFHFKPVIRAINASTAGSVTFRVMSDAGTPGDTTDDFTLDGAAYDIVDDSVDPEVVAASGSSGTDPDDDTVHGYVLHPAVKAGIYRLDVASRDHDAHTQQLVVAAANLADLGTILLAGTAGVIEGAVTTKVTLDDGTTGEFAVEGATVTATAVGDASPAATDETSSIGEFALSPLASGTYDLLATKAGYQNAAGQGTPRVFGAPSAPVTLELTPLTADVTGTVTATNGSGVGGVTVQAWIRGELVATTTADGSGAYGMTALPTGDYEITAESGALSGSAELAHVGGGSAAVVNLVVE